MVVGLLRDIRVLIRQGIALARHEVQYEIGKILRAAAWFGIAVVLTVIGLFVIAAACVLILFEYTGLPAWVCAAIISIISYWVRHAGSWWRDGKSQSPFALCPSEPC